MMAVDSWPDEKSPCLKCPHKGRDKNHEGCTKCEDRLAFIKIEKLFTPKAMPDPTLLHHIPETLPTKPKRRGRPPGKKVEILTKPPKTSSEKICSKCNIKKDFEKDFHDNPGARDGKHSNCKACRKW